MKIGGRKNNHLVLKKLLGGRGGLNHNLFLHQVIFVFLLYFKVTKISTFFVNLSFFTNFFGQNIAFNTTIQSPVYKKGSMYVGMLHMCGSSLYFHPHLTATS